MNEFFTRLAEEARAAGGRLAAWWGERRCLAALDGQAAPDGYGRLELPGRAALDLLLELDRGTEDHERLRQKARRYAKALARSDLADDDRSSSSLVPTLGRAATAPPARSPPASAPIRVIVWTPQRSPLARARATRSTTLTH